MMPPFSCEARVLIDTPQPKGAYAWRISIKAEVILVMTQLRTLRELPRGCDKNIHQCDDQWKGQWVTASPSRECRTAAVSSIVPSGAFTMGAETIGRTSMATFTLFGGRASKDERNEERAFGFGVYR